MHLVFGSDHGGYALKKKLIAFVEKQGHSVIDLGCHSEASVDYPFFAVAVAKEVIKTGHFGILLCGTGIGISIAANKISSVRCALCTNTTMAKLTRQHNDANILALGGRIIGEEVAKNIVTAFLHSTFEGGRHKKRVDKIEKIHFSKQ